MTSAVNDGPLAHGSGASPSARPPISIAMATCNGLPYVRAQLASILQQIDPSDQLVIVDDASDDGTWDYLLSLKHPAIELLRHPVNEGIRATFDDALHACRHAIVFLSDQDDLWASNKCARVLQAFAARPDTTVVVSDARVIDRGGRVTAPSFMATRGGFRGDLWSTVVKNRYLGCAMIVRRDVLSLALPLPRGAPMHDMWLGAMGKIRGPVFFIEEPLLDYRRHERNASPSTRRPLWEMTRSRIGFVTAIVARLLGRRLRRASVGR